MVAGRSPKGRIGFIGLGDMGKPMARRLLGQGWAVVSCVHRRRQAIDELAAEGLVAAASPRAVAEATDTVIVMVRDEAAAGDAIRGERSALAGMRAGATLVIMSTLGPDFCRQVAAEAARAGVDVLDAPVSGFPFRAEQGTLAIMVGGDAAAYERCRPLLEAMGRTFACGGVGMGMVTKLANNAVAIGTMALLAEARALARAHGMPAERLMEILGHSSADSFVMRNWDAIAAMWDHVTALGEKDVGIFLDAAGAHGLDTPLAAATSRYPWDGVDVG